MVKSTVRVADVTRWRAEVQGARRRACWWLTVAATVVGLMLAGRAGAAEIDPGIKKLMKDPELFPQVLQRLQAKYKREITHFSATLVRRQNKSETPGGLSKWEKITLRLREKGGPWAVYMYFRKGKTEGLEALYVQGRYNNKLWVKHPLLRALPPFSLAIDDERVMKENRHPITMAGVGRLMDSLMEQVRLAAKYGDVGHAFRYLGPGRIDGRPTIKIVRQLPKRDGYYCHKAVIELDQEWGYPVKVTTVDWDGVVLEQVVYEDIKWNDPEVNGDSFDKDKIFSIFKILGP